MSDDRPAELQDVIDKHANLKRLEAETREARLQLGRALATARAADISQKRISEETSESRENLRRWERAAEKAGERAAS